MSCELPFHQLALLNRRIGVHRLRVFNPPPTFHDHLHRVTHGTGEVPTVPSREPAIVGLLLAREDFHVKACLLLLFVSKQPMPARSFKSSTSQLLKERVTNSTPGLDYARRYLPVLAAVWLARKQVAR